MSNSQSAIVQVIVFGHQISLMGNYQADDGLLLAMDITPEDKEMLQQNVEDLSEEEQKLLKDHVKVDGDFKAQLDDRYGKQTDWKQKITSLFHRVQINELALFRDTKNKKTLFFLDVLVNLKDGGLKSKDGRFELEFIALDILVSSAEKMEEEDQKRKQAIYELKREIKGKGSVNKQLEEATKAIAKTEKTLASAQEKLVQFQQQFGKKEGALEKAMEAMIQRTKDMDALQEAMQLPKAIDKAFEDKKEIIDGKDSIKKGSEEWNEVMDTMKELWQ